MYNYEAEFKEALQKLGELYEEGKDCLNYIDKYNLPVDEQEKYDRMFGILQEMRDLSAITMKKLHNQSEN